MLTPPFLFPTESTCPRPAATAPVPRGDRPSQMALADDGAAHVLLGDRFSVCWWSVSEDGDARLHAVWPLPGPHPVAVATTPDLGVLLLGRTADGWAITVVRDGQPAGDVVLGGGGELVRFQVDAEGRYARVAWREGATVHYRRVDLHSGAIDELAQTSGISGVARAG